MALNMTSGICGWIKVKLGLQPACAFVITATQGVATGLNSNGLSARRNATAINETY
jgi:hypothetical protein